MLDLIWPRKSGAIDQAVRRLTESTPCYSLGIDRSGGVEPVVEQILECLHGESRTIKQAEQCSHE